MGQSRLRRRQSKTTVNIKVKSTSGGQYVETNAFADLVFTRQQVAADELYTEQGSQVVVDWLFIFEALAGESLPAITEEHIIEEISSGDRYEIVKVETAETFDRLLMWATKLR